MIGSDSKKTSYYNKNLQKVLVSPNSTKNLKNRSQRNRSQEPSSQRSETTAGMQNRHFFTSRNPRQRLLVKTGSYRSFRELVNKRDIRGPSELTAGDPELIENYLSMAKSMRLINKDKFGDEVSVLNDYVDKKTMIVKRIFESMYAKTDPDRGLKKSFIGPEERNDRIFELIVNFNFYGYLNFLRILGKFCSLW